MSGLYVLEDCELQEKLETQTHEAAYRDDDDPLSDILNMESERLRAAQDILDAIEDILSTGDPAMDDLRRSLATALADWCELYLSEHIITSYNL